MGAELSVIVKLLSLVKNLALPSLPFLSLDWYIKIPAEFDEELYSESLSLTVFGPSITIICEFKAEPFKYAKYIDPFE